MSTSTSTSTSTASEPTSPPVLLLSSPAGTTKASVASYAAVGTISFPPIQRPRPVSPPPPVQPQQPPPPSANYKRAQSLPPLAFPTVQPPFFSPNTLSTTASPVTFEFPSTPRSSHSAKTRPASPSSAGSKGVPPPPPRHDRRLSLQPGYRTAGLPAELPRGRKHSQQVYGAEPTPRAASGAARPDAANQLEAKVVILGSQGVGKTAIVHRYTSGIFSRSLSSTLGASFLTKRLELDGCKVRLQLWDTAGQERFRSMAPLYYRGALAAILVYDITNMQSFKDVKIWLDELRREMSPDLIIHVVGSKFDLAAEHRKVDLQFARKTVAEWMLEGTEPEPPRDPSPPSPSRVRIRTLSTRAGSSGGGASGPPVGLPSSVSMPSFHTTPPPPLQSTPSLGARVRKMSTKLVAPPMGLTGSSSSASSISEGQSEGMVRSGSRLSLSLGFNSRARKSYEEERKTQEDLERERVDEMISKCKVEVTEASAEDDYGVEDVFLLITRRLVERKSQIENERILRSRDSIMLHEATQPQVTSSWCC
ncbi:hypothetical protein MNV49_000290 [Pseudohyphozyma bogoriensis]|nr:hypothetical protein MNV49_000290 [Pseudohyphozyma bogoriensis]